MSSLKRRPERSAWKMWLSALLQRCRLDLLGYSIGRTKLHVGALRLSPGSGDSATCVIWRNERRRCNRHADIWREEGLWP